MRNLGFNRLCPVDGNGLMGKISVEMNTFPSHPAEYESAVGNIDDAPA